MYSTCGHVNVACNIACGSQLDFKLTWAGCLVAFLTDYNGMAK